MVTRSFLFAERILFTAILISTISFMTFLAYGEVDWAETARSVAISVGASSMASFIIVRLLRRG